MSSLSNSVRLFVERRWRLPPLKQVATTLLCSDASVGWQSLVLLSQPSLAGDSVLVEDPATLRGPDPRLIHECVEKLYDRERRVHKQWLGRSAVP